MTRKYLALVISIVLCIVFGIVVTYYFINPNENTTNSIGTNVNNNNQSNNNKPDNYNALDLPTVGNDTVLTTKSDTSIRVINEYDKDFFTANKNLLIMFASWCPNCQEEISEIEKILEHYKNNKSVNVILIAHEYEGTVTDLIKLVEKNVNFGAIEVKLDLGRIIRKTIDPEASTIPISYVVDKNGKVLEVHNESLTLEKAIEMVGK